ncbi:hypothetical protein [Pollutimonas harenae]|uniref:Ribosomal protein S3AE n=1 Tax=Pollutimonas harenae TaxID=657015 RepID=A0A853H084_9BURK|nr:hypothetical protein [Pollutimonas harenae]NYT85109.1 hypothetical protein [Pollutimonas harenae]TEA72510.1 hypothetical protein ERD84_00935 [Pollutimonas harenae]
MPSLRTACPPGTCICEREQLLSSPDNDMRVLLLTREEEKKLIRRLECLASLADLRHMQALIYKQLGVVVDVTASSGEVRTVMGLHIELREKPGLCRKVRASIPAAIRRGLAANERIVYELLDEGGLFGSGLSGMHE